MIWEGCSTEIRKRGGQSAEKTTKKVVSSSRRILNNVTYYWQFSYPCSVAR
jgi:hypothetical protein